MTARLRELRNWFPSGTAEGERSIMEQAFVYVREFESIISPPEGNPHLLVGRKGTGKSAVLDFAERVLGKQHVPVIVLTPQDLDTSNITPSDSAGDITRRFRSVILKAIVAKLAEKTPNFATGDQAAIYHQAVAAGDISPDLVGRILRLLPDLAKPMVKADLSNVFPKLTAITRSELEAAVGRSLRGKRFYLFIDDTDQVASPSQSGHLNRIWGLILAVRALSAAMPELRAIVTLRTEVWERLKRDAAAQRDQTDHFSNLVVELSSDDDQIRKIVKRRLELAADALKLSGESYGIFFDRDAARAPHSEDYRTWDDLIIGRSRGRPRDAIQLIGSLADQGIKSGNLKITEADFRAVMPIFSERRAELFSQEVSSEFEPALEIVQSFAFAQFEHGTFLMSADELKNHLKSILSRFTIRLFGETLHQNNEDHIFSIWRFLYNSNVINARISDASQPKAYRHERPERDPMLVTKARWNELQAILWEINTSFRDYLIAKQDQETKRVGLPTKPRTTGRRKRR